MVWLNIDIPEPACTLHREGCRRKPSAEPEYKGFGTLKRDGGWLSFATESEAKAYYQKEWEPRGYDWIDCSYCRE